MILKESVKQPLYRMTYMKPAESFYRNLMTQEHMTAYGGEISGNVSR